MICLTLRVVSIDAYLNHQNTLTKVAEFAKPIHTANDTACSLTFS